MQPAHGLEFQIALRHMNSDAAIEIARRGHGALQQVQCAGFDTVRRQHSVDKAVMSAVVALDEIDRVRKALQSPRLVECRLDTPWTLQDHPTGAIGGAQKDPEPEIARRVGRSLEFRDGLGPLAIVE